MFDFNFGFDFDFDLCCTQDFYYYTRGPEDVFSKKHVMVSQGPIDKIKKAARLPPRIQHITVRSSSYAAQ